MSRRITLGVLANRLLSVAALLGVLAGCKSSTAPAGSANSGSGQGQGGAQQTITIANNSFSPTPDTVSAGQVTFSWSAGSNGHNVTWDTGPAPLPTNSATQSSGTYTPTLQAGTYTYHCSIHGGPGTGMWGQIVVR